MNLKPQRAAQPFFGGLHSATILREDVPFFKVDVNYNFAMDATKYELILNHVAVESLNVDLVRPFFYMFSIKQYDLCQHFLINGCFQKGDYQGKIFFDRVNKNFLLNKFKITGKVIKMGAEVFMVRPRTILNSVSGSLGWFQHKFQNKHFV